MIKSDTVSWTNYCLNYENFQKKVVFQFTVGMGGIGDYLKFFTHLLLFCISNEIKMHYVSGVNPLDEFIKLTNSKMLIHPHDITCYEKINNFDELFHIESDKYYIVEPYCMYELCEIADFRLDEIFYFSNEVIQNVANIHNSYSSIHLRLGDAYLECDKQYVICPSDIRIFDEEKLCQFIEDNYITPIFFFCDNKTYKQNLKKRYPAIQITDFDIGHTSLVNTTREQYLNAVTEFFILSQSQNIYAASKSGFSIMASKFSNAPLIDLSSL